MSLETFAETARPSAVGTYATSNTLSENYSTTASITDGTATKNLAVKYFYPTVSDYTEPRPIVFLVSNSGWSSSATSTYNTEGAYLNGMGVHAACIETRVSGDSPLSDGDDVSHTTLRRAIRAAIFDLDEAVKYTLKEHLENAAWTIEPSMMFFGGVGAGGITAMLYPLFFPTRPVAGVVPCSAAFGYDGTGTTPNTATEIIRQQLRYKETQHKSTGLAFLGGADTTVGTTYIESFRTKQATIGASVVQYDADGTNVAYSAFDTSALSGATTMAGAWYNFLVDRCESLPSTAALRQRGLQFRRSWVKQQSRFW